MATISVKEAAITHDVSQLIQSAGGATIYPSDDHLLALLHARFRSDLPYTRLSPSTLLVVNPLKALAHLNEASAKDYVEAEYSDTSGDERPGGPMQPHLYDLAAKVYLLMSRKKENQAVSFSGITGSGKSFSSELFISQVLRLSAHTKKEQRISNQIKAIFTVLDSFGNSKTAANPSASRYGKFLELHFSETGRISGAKVLAFGLDKSRVNRLSQNERSFNIFYQLLAGASPDEREALNLDEPSSYALLASSGCYLLPGGPLSDDHAQMGELRAALALLGFKPKHVSSIFTLLTAILLLGNLEFIDNGDRELTYESATVANITVLYEVSNLLQVSSEELQQALTNKTTYVRNDLTSKFLMSGDAGLQRDALVRDLYALLFAFVVETINHKLDDLGEPFKTSITIFDQPGFQSRSSNVTDKAPLVAANGQNSFEEFCFNFSAETLHSSFIRRAFDDSIGYNALMSADRISISSVLTMDNAACVELLRGGPLSSRADRKPGGVLGSLARACTKFSQGKTSEWDKDVEVLEDMIHKFGSHPSFVTSPGVGMGPAGDKTLFGINHYTGSCSYDARGFVERDADILDSSLVQLLRGSADSFIAKLVSGPGIASEFHPHDPETVVQAQVSVTPLRHPTLNTQSPFSDTQLPSPLIEQGAVYPVTTQLNATLAELLTTIEKGRTWDVICIRPNDNSLANSFDKRRVKSQIRSFLLPDLVVRRQVEYTTFYELPDFISRYNVPNGQASDSIDVSVRKFVTERSWTDGLDYTIGEHSIWLSYDAWREVDDELRDEEKKAASGFITPSETDDQSMLPSSVSHWGVADNNGPTESSDDLLLRRTNTTGSAYLDPAPGHTYEPYDNAGGNKAGYAPSWIDPDQWDSKPAQSVTTLPDAMHPEGHRSGEDELGGMIVNEKTGDKTLEIVETSRARRWWVRFVWLLTWWIPEFMITKVGKMTRPDVRMAWREKVAICVLIFLLCGIVIFYVVVFGLLLCPDYKLVWNTSELGEHAQSNDFWVAAYGKVYDITSFWKGQHSDVSAYPVTSEIMLELAGQDLTYYFPVVFPVACAGLVTDESLALQRNFTAVADYAVHWSGTLQTYGSAKLNNSDWLPDRFLPFMKEYYKGTFVYSRKEITSNADSGSKTWAIYDNGVYDLSDYLTTITYHESDTDSSKYSFLNDSVTSIFSDQPGLDITKKLNAVFETMNGSYASMQYACLRNAFYVGEADIRETPRCTVNNYILLSFSILIMVTIFMKFLSALQLTGKRNPEMQDKFVICQIPCYTEGEESLRRTIDSIAALKYDDKRKLIFIICDGNIIGSGNDKSTPRIVLDILGVDEKLDPEALLFKSVGEGSKQLNYGKVYSGLYEFEGHVVPYMVTVKVGKPSERSKPGNRGKRDSQILLLRYLNRVHFDAPMSPFELEMYHQMRNIIGIDPAFYEYLFQVDADTTVSPESLNRMVAVSVDDSTIIGVCGETKLQNEMQSITTMIQVYEYFMSHHLAKAFESLFGSVTCLPGCFSLYRLRTADKGRPIIISQRVIDDYSEPNVDTLHKKNLFSLGEDRYLTTLMMKYFPSFKMKFTSDAIAYTVAPDRWEVLLSQRRRWINSTIHNLAELTTLPEMCGFCLFSMRFIVYLDLVGTIILPATCVYLFYLIIVVAIGSSPIPTLALILIGITYGLQAVIFLIKREFMLVGWMVIYILAYPVYSFFLPIYSFWYMDDFSWGNTRVVVGEGKDKTVMTTESELFDDSMVPLKKFSEYEAEAWDQPSRPGSVSGPGSNYGYPHDDKRSQYNSSPGPRMQPQQPQSYAGSQTGGDYYRDASPLKHHNSNPNLRNSRAPSLAPPTMYNTGYNPSQNSLYGASTPFMSHPMGLPTHAPSEFSAPLYPPQFPGLGPRSTMMSFSGSQGGPPSTMGGFMGGGQPGMGNPRMSTFSLATTANPFAASAPSDCTDPSDEEILAELRHYLSTQDLMAVTKKTSRAAVFARFPKADLSGKVPWINTCIDKILQGQM